MRHEITLPNPHPTQKEFLECSSRFRVLMCGRRWGKSLISQSESIKSALLNQEVAYITPTYLLAKYFFDEITSRLPDRVYTSNKQDLVIRLMTGGYIQFFTGERLDNLRGRKFHKVIIDEGSYIPNLQDGWNNSIRPTLTDYQGTAIFLSTPKGKNFFYSLYLRGLQDENWKSFRFSTYENPYIPNSEIDDAKNQLPDAVFKQEYLAEPSENADNPFGLERISNCIKPLSSLKPVIYGIDLAKSVDYTVIIGLDIEGNVCRFERFQKDWEQTKVAIKSLPYAPINMDSTGIGDPITEDLQNQGMDITGVKFTQQSKQQMMIGLSSAIHQQKIGFPDGVIRNELDIIEYQYSANGVKYSAPSGFHDDCVMALALAWSGFNSNKSTGNYSIEIL